MIDKEMTATSTIGPRAGVGSVIGYWRSITMDLLPYDLRARMNTLIIGSMMDGEGRIFIHLRPTHMQSYVGSIVHILTITSQIED